MSPWVKPKPPADISVLLERSHREKARRDMVMIFILVAISLGAIAAIYAISRIFGLPWPVVTMLISASVFAAIVFQRAAARRRDEGME